MAVAILIFLIRLMKPHLRYYFAYIGGDWSDKLVLYLGHRLYRKRRDKELAAKVNYREQLECLYDRRIAAHAPDSALMKYTGYVMKDGKRVNSDTLEELIAMTERAGFSADKISEEEFRLSKDRIKELFRKAHGG